MPGLRLAAVGLLLGWHQLTQGQPVSKPDSTQVRQAGYYRAFDISRQNTTDQDDQARVNSDFVRDIELITAGGYGGCRPAPRGLPGRTGGPTPGRGRENAPPPGGSIFPTIAGEKHRPTASQHKTPLNRRPYGRG